MLQQVTDVLRNLWTRDSRVDALLQLVEFVQHEQDPSWAHRINRRREVKLEGLECVLSGECLIQRGQERQLVGPSRITLRQAGKPCLDTGVAQRPAGGPGEELEDVSRGDAAPAVVALRVLQRAVDRNPSGQHIRLPKLSENRGLSGAAISLEQDRVRMGARPELTLDSVHDVGAAEEHLVPIHRVADDVGTRPQVAGTHHLSGRKNTKCDLHLVIHGGPVEPACPPGHDDGKRMGGVARVNRERNPTGLAIGQVWKLAGPGGRSCADVQVPKRYRRRIGQTKLNLADCANGDLGRFQADFELGRLLHDTHLSLCQRHHCLGEGTKAIGGGTIGPFKYPQGLMQPRQGDFEDREPPRAARNGLDPSSVIATCRTTPSHPPIRRLPISDDVRLEWS